MKHVFKNANEVAHIWAQQLPEQAHARCANASYEDKNFYSYRTLIASFFTDDVVFVTEHNYSNTTSKHIYDVLRAVKHKTVIRVPGDIPYSLESAVRFIVEEFKLQGWKQSIANYRVQKMWESELKKISELFPDTVIPELKFCLTAEEVAKKEEVASKRSKPSASSTEAFHTKLREIVATSGDNADEWRNHQPLTGVLLIGSKIRFKENGKTYTRTIPSHWELPEELRKFTRNPFKDTVLLRLSKDLESIETSLGANVSLREAKVLYDLLKRGSDIKGFRIGYYTVIGKTDTHIQIGCHTIELSEVELLAQKLGWVS